MLSKNSYGLLLSMVISSLFFNCEDANDTPNFADDSNIRLTSVTSYTSTNPHQIFTFFFDYDTQNRLIKIRSNSLGSTVEYLYDVEDRLTQIGDYKYFYDSSNNIIKIKNDNLITALGVYDSTMVFYNQGKITSIVESFTNDSSKTTNTTDVSYNNKEQIRLTTTTSKILNFDTGQEFVRRKDREIITYNHDDNIQSKTIESDIDSNNFLEIEETYDFDTFNNPVKLIQKSTNFHENNTVLSFSQIASKNSFSTRGIISYFKNNNILYESIPHTEDNGFVKSRFKSTYTYNKYGYPVTAEEVQSLLNQDIEFSVFTSWEYEEY